MVKNLLGILAIVLMFGLMVVGCVDDNSTNGGSAFDGTWFSDGEISPGMGYMRIIANNGNFVEALAESKTAINWKNVLEGTYPKNAQSPVEVTITRVNTILMGQADEWKTWGQLTPQEIGLLGHGVTQKMTLVIANNQFTMMGITFTRQ